MKSLDLSTSIRVGCVATVVAAVLGCTSSDAPPAVAPAGGSSGGSSGQVDTSAGGAGNGSLATGGRAGSGGSTIGTSGISGSSGTVANSNGGASGQASSGGGFAGSSSVAGAGGGGSSGAENGGGGTGGSSGSADSGPPMGWASWNTFAAKINHDVIEQQADAMVASGLKAAGYQYLNIDEGWWQGTRDAAGNITVDEADWPGGMSAIADYIHGLGLKAGIYTDAGKDGCGYYFPTGRPAAPGSGSEGHYEQDFLAFSKWGFDFVKVDWCGGDKEGLDAPKSYQAIADAIGKATAQTGRSMALSVCNWGKQDPWSWAPALSTMWRTSYDIIYYGESADMTKVLSNFDSALHPTAQSPGHYNDPDMLIVGMPSFSPAQNRTHLSLWAIAGAPLLAGNNLATMSDDTKRVLTNSEVIAIDRDPLAKQGTRVADSGGRQVYSRELSGTRRRAVLLLNRSTSSATITVRFADIGLGSRATVRNVWTATDLGSQSTSYAASVPAGDSVLLLVTGE